MAETDNNSYSSMLTIFTNFAHPYPTLKNFKEPEGMLARWLSVLGTYDFTLEHRPGVKHGNADGMSRAPGRGKRKPCQRGDCPQCQDTQINKTEQERLIAVVTRSQARQVLMRANTLMMTRTQLMMTRAKHMSNG